MPEERAIRIGILHSSSGTMASSEKPLIDTLLIGIDELNASGGLLGRKIESIIVDSQSDPEHAAREAERLILEQHVDVIFGCWTSACRKAVKPIMEKHNGLLFYPGQYEGLELSPNIIYTGATPNQQIIPGVNWALNNLGNNIYLLGSDYISPHTANFIIRDIVKIKKAQIVAERYVPIGSDDFDTIIEDIKQRQPDVILNTINGDSNQHFFAKKHQAGLDNIPVISFSIAEAELATIADARLNNHYAVWNYFQSIDSQVNQDFIKKVKRTMGQEQTIGGPMEASYIGLKLWSQAVIRADATNTTLVRIAIGEQGMSSPSGHVSIDSNNYHLRKTVRIGQARQDGQFDIIWTSKQVVRPHPFPSYRDRFQWKKISQQLLEAGES